MKKCIVLISLSTQNVVSLYSFSSNLLFSPIPQFFVHSHLQKRFQQVKLPTIQLIIDLISLFGKIFGTFKFIRNSTKFLKNVQLSFTYDKFRVSRYGRYIGTSMGVGQYLYNLSLSVSINNLPIFL